MFRSLGFGTNLLGLYPIWLPSRLHQSDCLLAQAATAVERVVIAGIAHAYKDQPLGDGVIPEVHDDYGCVYVDYIGRWYEVNYNLQSHIQFLLG